VKREREGKRQWGGALTYGVKNASSKKEKCLNPQRMEICGHKEAARARGKTVARAVVGWCGVASKGRVDHPRWGYEKAGVVGKKEDS